MHVYIVATDSGVDGYLSQEKAKAQYWDEIADVLEDAGLWQERFEYDKEYLEQVYERYVQRTKKAVIVSFINVIVDEEE